MTISYRPLVTLSIQHDYYKSGISNDFGIHMTAGAEKNLQAGKMMKRIFSSSAKIFYKEVDNAPVVPITSDLTLTFFLQLQTPQLLNFTDLPARSPGQVFYFKNVTGTVLERSVVNLRSRLLNLAFTSASDNTVQLTILDAQGQIVFDKSITGENQKFSVQVDLRNKPEGLYTVKKNFPNDADPADELFYLDDKLPGLGVFAIAAITINSNTEKSFTISLQKKSAAWKYFLVDKPNSVSTYQITDTASQVTFTEQTIASGSDEEKTKNLLISQSPGAVVKLFASDSAISFSEEPRAGLELSRDLNLIIENLPNPNVSLPKPEVIVYVS